MKKSIKKEVCGANSEIGGSWLTVNRSCNNRCEWCYATGTKFKDAIMSVKMARKLINLFSELGIKKTILIGGEPTVYPYLTQVTKMLLEKGIEPVLISNGRRFSDLSYAKSVVDSGLTKINFSAKAANREQYKRLMKRDGYDEVIKGVKNLSNLGIEVPFSVTIFSELVSRLPEMFHNLFEAGVRSYSIDFGNPVVMDSKVSGEGIPDPLECAKMIPGICEIMETMDVEYSFHMNIPFCLIPADIKDSLLENNRIVSCCHVMDASGLIFDAKGNVLPCNMLFDFPLGQYGEDFITAEEFNHFWSGKKINRFRKAFFRYPTEQCISCSDWDSCGGGCPVKWLYWKPSDFIERR